MSPAIATALIAVGTLLCTALGLAAGALWRLGNKVGGFEAAVVAANVAATAAKRDNAKKAAVTAHDAAVAGIKKFHGVSGLANGHLAVRITEQAA